MDTRSITIACFVGRQALRGLRRMHERHGGSPALTLMIYHISGEYICYAEHLPARGTRVNPLPALGTLATHVLRLDSTVIPEDGLAYEERVELENGDDLWLIRYGDFICACSGSIDDEWDRKANLLLASWCQSAMHEGSRHLYTHEQLLDDKVLGYLHQSAYRGIKQIELIPPRAVLSLPHALSESEELPTGSSSSFSRTRPFLRPRPSSLRV